jgi:signal transduction histidine kinase
VLVGGRSLAAIIGGQRVPADPAARSALADSIRERHPERAADLLTSLAQDYAAGMTVVCDAGELSNLLKGLCGFASLLTDLCETNARHQTAASERESSEYWVKRIVEASSAAVAQQQQVLRECLSHFCGFTRVTSERCGLFTGRYEERSQSATLSLREMDSKKWWHSSKFALEDHGLPEVCAYSPGSAPPGIAEAVGAEIARKKHLFCVLFPPPGAWQAAQPVMLAIVQRASPPEGDDRRFCEEFLRSILQAFSMAETLRWHRDQEQAIERLIVDIRHGLGTTAQYVVYRIEHLIRHARSIGQKDGESALSELVTALEDSVDAHQMEIELLVAPHAEPGGDDIHPIDVFRELRRQVQLFNAVGQMRGVRLALSELPARNAYVQCSSALFARAIGALLDNAIKYSYRDNRAVRVSGSVRGDVCEITIENYGIGIPAAKLELIGRRKYRADVPDDRVARPGTGLGVSIASAVFEKAIGGELSIESFRPGSVKGEMQDYHRYITRVTVKLPVTVHGAEEESHDNM